MLLVKNKKIIINQPGLYPRQFNGDPQTLTVATIFPASAFRTTIWPSVEPAANATPKGWKLSDIHSCATLLNQITLNKFF